MANSNAERGSVSSLVYKLKVPLEHGDDVISELRFRKPKLKHLKMLDGAKGNFEILSRMIVTLCDVRAGLVDELDPADFDEIGKIIEGFFPKHQQTS